MKTGKQLAKEVLDALPDDVTLEEIQYHLYVRQKIERGLQDMKEGNVHSHEHIVRESEDTLDS